MPFMPFMVPPAVLSQPSPLLTDRQGHVEEPRIRRRISLPRLPSRIMNMSRATEAEKKMGLVGGPSDGYDGVVFEEDDSVKASEDESSVNSVKSGFRYTIQEVDGEPGGGEGHCCGDGGTTNILRHSFAWKQDDSTRGGRSVMFAADKCTGLDGCSAPDKHSSFASDDTLTQSNYLDKSPDPIGKWRCCKCKKGHDIFSVSHESHPVSVLNCVCTHRSCWACALDGLIKSFEPMNDPEVVQLSEDGRKQVRFGVFCDGCGLSWRAQEISAGLSSKSALQRISAIPKFLVRRGAHPLQKLRHSQSMNNLAALPTTCPRPAYEDADIGASRSVLNLRALSDEMAKGHGKQAEFATVKFIGIQCTCGLTTDVTSLCFQVVDPPVDLTQAKTSELEECKGPSFTSTPADLARGHGTPVIRLRGGAHPNPLRSNPVQRPILDDING